MHCVEDHKIEKGVHMSEKQLEAVNTLKELAAANPKAADMAASYISGLSDAVRIAEAGKKE